MPVHSGLTHSHRNGEPGEAEHRYSWYTAGRGTPLTQPIVGPAVSGWKLSEQNANQTAFQGDENDNENFGKKKGDDLHNV